MSLFEKYEDEAEFRGRFVKPLLNRMGFHGVALEHGSQEYGKDFVFSELHRLCGVRHYAAQVKHEESISQGRQIDGLLTQIRQAFSMPFKRADSPRDCYVAAVFVFNSGAITANARQQIAAELVRERYGDNVHLFDGDRLDAINQFSSYQEDRDVRLRIAGLYGQLRLNLQIAEAMAQIAEAIQANPIEFTLEGRGVMLGAVESFLTYPLPDADKLLELMFTYHQQGKIINAVNERLRFTVMTDEAKKSEARTMAMLLVGLKATTGLIACILPGLLSRYLPVT